MTSLAENPRRAPGGVSTRCSNTWPDMQNDISQIYIVTEQIYVVCRRKCVWIILGLREGGGEEGHNKDQLGGGDGRT